MANLTITGSVTRLLVPGGPLAALSVQSPGAYSIISVGPGLIAWRRQTAESKWVHGRYLTAAVMDVEMAPLKIRVYGSSAAALDANTAALLAALHQFAYQLTLTIDGITTTWSCEPADGGPAGAEEAGSWDKFSLMERQQVYAFQIPRNPVPVAGSM